MHRDLSFVAIISVIAIFVSQLYDVFVGLDNYFVNHMIPIMAKTFIVSVFLVLGTSWVIQIAHTPKL